MKFASSLLAGLLVVSIVQGQEPAKPAAPPVDPKNAQAIGSYGIGMSIGRNIKRDGLEVDLESFLQGVQVGLKGGEPKYSEEQIRSAFKILQGQMVAKKQERDKTLGEKNLKEGEDFLAANKNKQGVVTLPSGLQYQVIRSGNGPSPKGNDIVKVHYEGTLLDGTVFDSSIKRKEPAEFPVDGVIPGWTEALKRMKVGDRWRLFIPSKLAYGARGAGDEIGPNAVLIFDVELLGIQPQPAEKQ